MSQGQALFVSLFCFIFLTRLWFFSDAILFLALRALRGEVVDILDDGGNDLGLEVEKEGDGAEVCVVADVGAAAARASKTRKSQ